MNIRDLMKLLRHHYSNKELSRDMEVVIKNCDYPYLDDIIHIAKTQYKNGRLELIMDLDHSQEIV